jgi:hypothetical protein
MGISFKNDALGEAPFTGNVVRYSTVKAANEGINFYRYPDRDSVYGCVIIGSEFGFNTTGPDVGAGGKDQYPGKFFFANNTIYSVGTRFFDLSSCSWACDTCGSDNKALYNVSYKHNWTGGLGTRWFIGWPYWASETCDECWEIDSNYYYDPSQAFLGYVSGGDGVNDTTKTWTQWQTDNNLDVNSYNSDPGLNDPANGDFSRPSAFGEMNRTYGGRTWTIFGAWQDDFGVNVTCIDTTTETATFEINPNNYVSLDSMWLLLSYTNPPTDRVDSTGSPTDPDTLTNGTAVNLVPYTTYYVQPIVKYNNGLYDTSAVYSVRTEAISINSKQLNIGVLSYWGNCPTADEIYDNVAMRDFVANHFGWWVASGGGLAADSIKKVVDSIKADNPNFTTVHYHNHIRPYADTGHVQDWMTTESITDSLYIRNASGGEEDSSIVRPMDFTGDFRTTYYGEILAYDYFSLDRYAWDLRYNDVGNYLYSLFSDALDSLGGDGIFDDEWAQILCSQTIKWTVDLMFPFSDTTTIAGNVNANIWTYGDPFSINNPWDNALSPCEIRDSLYELTCNNWAKILADSFAANNQTFVINPATYGSPYSTNTFWDDEYRHLLSESGMGAVLGEFANYHPSEDGKQDFCNNMATAAGEVRDSNLTIWVWPIRVGQSDSSAADSFTIARTRMNALGFILDCLYPGNTSYGFAPHSAWPSGGVCGGNMLLSSRTLNGITLADTVTNWDDAYGKYFGIPQVARAETLSGSDPQSQAYTIHEIELNKPEGGVLTRAVGRYASGSNRKPGATAVTYTMPAGTWYELESGGTWASVGATVGIANAQWRFFSSDTIYSNTGSPESGQEYRSPIPLRNAMKLQREMER